MRRHLPGHLCHPLAPTLPAGLKGELPKCHASCYYVYIKLLVERQRHEARVHVPVCTSAYVPVSARGCAVPEEVDNLKAASMSHKKRVLHCAHVNLCLTTDVPSPQHSRANPRRRSPAKMTS